ncbi:MAG: DNA-binding protein [Spirochaetia bacterium]|nr:DNA-binding protein [Spirochaetia bacterium]
MKQSKRILVLIITLLVSFAVFQCKEKIVISEPDEQAAFYKGTVAETMNSGGYTYILMKGDDGKYFWMACLEVSVKKGDKITAAKGYVMRNFTSKTLKKTFPSILFIDTVTPDDVTDKNANAENQKLKNFAGSEEEIKSKGRQSVNDCYKDIAILNGKTVVVRGKVVKFLPDIMNKNWIHLQDGTGKDGSNDLAVTTKGKSKVGDIVVITGKLAKDKDFGSGYKYSVIVEDASIVVE